MSVPKENDQISMEGPAKFHQKSTLYIAQNENMTKQHMPVKSQEFRKDTERVESAMQKQETTFREKNN